MQCFAQSVVLAPSATARSSWTQSNRDVAVRRPARAVRPRVHPRVAMHAGPDAGDSARDAQPIPDFDDVSAPLSAADIVPQGGVVVPSLLRGPQAIFGVLLAASSLVVDAARALTGALPPEKDAGARSVMRGDFSEALAPTDKRLRVLNEQVKEVTARLDDAKRELMKREADLDCAVERANAAESALNTGAEDVRAQLQDALDRAHSADRALEATMGALEKERTRREEEEAVRTKMQDERDKVEDEISRRAEAVEHMMRQVEEMQAKPESPELSKMTEEVVILQTSVATISAQLEQATAEVSRLAEEKAQMQRKVEQLETQSNEAMTQLAELKAELAERREHDLAMQAELSKRADQESEILSLREAVNKAVGELADLQSKAAETDKTLGVETDALRSRLAAREVELAELTARLDAVQDDGTALVGDPRMSEVELEYVTANLDAEQLAQSAQIARASMMSDSASGVDDEDALRAVQQEMEVDEALLKAGLQKAQTTLNAEQQTASMRNDDVENVLSLLAKDKDADIMAVARMGSARSTEKTPPVPKRKRGRSKKVDEEDSTSTKSSEAADTSGKKKRGRPKKGSSKGRKNQDLIE